VPAWLTFLSWIALWIAFISCVWLIVEQFRHPQHAWIMYLVWPITALYMGPLAIRAYYVMGTRHHGKPLWQGVFVSATHCGAGCSLGDAIAEFGLFFTGAAFAGTMFYSELVGDYVLAFIFGIAFQYFAIAPAGVWSAESLRSALKSDTLTLTTFEIGLFGWMAIFQFILFPGIMPNSPVYWFMMQIGMCLGFVTSYPTNWWLIVRGVKHEM
jgi:Domain of unknown function (DUF4396)